MDAALAASTPQSAAPASIGAESPIPNSRVPIVASGDLIDPVSQPVIAYSRSGTEESLLYIQFEHTTTGCVGADVAVTETLDDVCT